MNKQDKKELDRLRKELAKAIPGSAHYKDLLEDRKNLAVAMKVEGSDPESSLIPGVKNETLAVGVIGGIQIFTLAKLQDTVMIAKNLIGKIPDMKIRL